VKGSRRGSLPLRTPSGRVLHWPAKIVLAFSGFCVAGRLLADAVYLLLSWQLLFSQTLWLFSAAATLALAGLVAGLILEDLPTWGSAALGALLPVGAFGGLVLHAGSLAAAVAIASCFFGVSLGRWLSHARTAVRRLGGLASLAQLVAFACSSLALFLVAVALLERLMGRGPFSLEPVFSWDLARLLVGLPTLWPGVARQEVLIALLAFPLAVGVAYVAASRSETKGRPVAGWALGISLALLWLGVRWWRLRQIALGNPVVPGLEWLFPAWALLVVALGLVAWLKLWRRRC